VELNAGAYTGKYTVNISDPKTIGGSGGYLDRRVYGAVVVYPQPIGFQAEVNVGEGPELAGSLVRGTRPLHGGYAMLFAKFGQFVPFVRGVLYDGGKKHEANAPRHEVQEVEGGLEVQFGKWLELTAVFNAANRTVNGKEQSGHFGRLQLQLNY
jgi:hypothetical protein